MLDLYPEHFLLYIKVAHSQNISKDNSLQYLVNIVQLQFYMIYALRSFQLLEVIIIHRMKN